MVKGKKTTRTEYVRKRDKRDDFIKQFGKGRFDSVSKTDKNWESLNDLVIPGRFGWIWSQFLQIWGTCEHDFGGNVILTPRSILDYCECFKTTMSVYEKRLVFRMKSWSQDEINKLNKKED